MLFCTQDDHVRDGARHIIFDAICEGLDQQRFLTKELDTSTMLDVCLLHSASHLLILCTQTFRGLDIPLIVAGLCANREIRSHAQIVPLLKPRVAVGPQSPGYDSSLDYVGLSALWMAALQRYLSGIGHPRHDDFRDLAKNDNEGYRSTLLLLAISDSRFLPRGHYDELEIRFVSAFAEEQRKHSVGEPDYLWKKSLT